MGRLYTGNDRELVTLFTYDDACDKKSYTLSWSSMSINKKTGELVVSYFDQPANNVMATSVSRYLSDFEELKKLLSTKKINLNGRDYSFDELNAENWSKWLKKNGIK